MEEASVIIVTYNQEIYIDQCIKSVQSQDFPHEIIVVDNSSNDETVNIIKNKYSFVKLVKNKQNLGYGAGNNIGVNHAKGNYIVILNPDTIVEAGWLKELLLPLKHKNIITTPKILSYNGLAINTCGLINHFTGLTFTNGLGKGPKDYLKQEQVSGFSGCCFAMKRNDYINLGGFDEHFFLYNEDADFSWRINMRGLKVLLVPTSLVRHDYRFSISPEKFYHLEKGRYLILRKYLSWYDILIFLPSLLIVEILTFGYAVKLGYAGIISKLKALRDGWSTRIEKEDGDKSQLFKLLETKIPVDQLTFNKSEKIIKIIANIIFKLNFRVFV